MLTSAVGIAVLYILWSYIIHDFRRWIAHPYNKRHQSSTFFWTVTLSIAMLIIAILTYMG